MRQYTIFLAVALIAGCAMAQNSSSPPMVNPKGDISQKTLDASSSVDDALDALDARGKGLQSFTTDVSWTDTDASVGASTTRSGKVVYQLKSNGDGRIRVTFDTLSSDGRSVREVLIYMLDDGKLVDRSYRTKSQTTRQVLRPGEKINLLKLGEGPFPLPIGQPKEEVYKQFDVKRIDNGNNDPPNTIHLQLIPKPGTRFARQFKTIDVWMDAKSHMPRRIATLDSTQTTIRTTDLQNVQVNPKVSDIDFTLEKIDTKNWNLVDEKFED